MAVSLIALSLRWWLAGSSANLWPQPQLTTTLNLLIPAWKGRRL